MSPRRLIGALVAFAVLGGASLVVAPSAISPALAVADVRAARNPEGQAVRPPAPEERPNAGDIAVFFALEVVGVPYRWGGESPTSGFDCSGLVRWSYARVGLDLPHNSHALYSVGRKVRPDAMAAGDVLFFEGLGHVGLYLGGGRMVHAPQSGRHVEVVDLAETNYGRRLIGVRRVAEI